MISRAIVQDSKGGPEVLVMKDVEVGEPGPDEARVRHTAIGINFIDVYVRTGLYPLMTLPGSPGMEAAGVVEAVGSGVTGLTAGDRVAYVYNVPGAYAERRVLPAARLVKLPDDIDDRLAAAMMLKGLTAAALLTRTTKAAAGDTVLVHAAAGGVGLILTAWAKHLGCTVIGTVGSDAKAALARAHGADHVIVTARDSVVERVGEITGGAGCRYVYDGVGKDTFEASLECVSKFGHVVSFGNASGAVPPISIAVLAPKCVALSRPLLFPYIAERAMLDAMAADLFDAVRKGIVSADINQTYPLADAAKAHRDLEARATTGQSLLIP